MRRRISSRWILLAVVYIGLIFFLVTLIYLINKKPIQSSSASLIEHVVVPPIQKQVIFGLPVRLKIPSIKVDAIVEHVGLTPEGAMDVPKKPEDVVWYEPGPRPGNKGSAVIAGHYGTWENGEGSVFDDLNKLKIGDEIYVQDDKGTIISFVVRATQKYDPDADAEEVFFSNDGISHLNLISCEGAWDDISKSYSERLIVFTDKK